MGYGQLMWFELNNKTKDHIASVINEAWVTLADSFHLFTYAQMNEFMMNGKVHPARMMLDAIQPNCTWNNVCTMIDHIRDIGMPAIADCLAADVQKNAEEDGVVLEQFMDDTLYSDLTVYSKHALCNILDRIKRKIVYALLPETPRSLHIGQMLHMWSTQCPTPTMGHLLAILHKEWCEPFAQIIRMLNGPRFLYQEINITTELVLLDPRIKCDLAVLFGHYHLTTFLRWETSVSDEFRKRWLDHSESAEAIFHAFCALSTYNIEDLVGATRRASDRAAVSTRIPDTISYAIESYAYDFHRRQREWTFVGTGAPVITCDSIPFTTRVRLAARVADKSEFRNALGLQGLADDVPSVDPIGDSCARHLCKDVDMLRDALCTSGNTGVAEFILDPIVDALIK